VRCTVPLDTDGFDIRAQVAMGGCRRGDTIVTPPLMRFLRGCVAS
jgi:hypothetical protein